MQEWLIFSLLSAIVLAGSELSQKIAMTRKANISAVTNNFYIWIVQGFVGFGLAMLWGQTSILLTGQNTLQLLLVSCFYFLGGALFYSSYKSNSSSTSIILGTISVVASSALGTIFLSESWSLSKAGGVICVLLAIIFLNLKPQDRLNKYNLLALAGGLCFGTAYTLDKSIVTGMSPFMYLGLMCWGVAIVSLVFRARLIFRETKKMRSQNFLPMLGSALFGSAFNIFTFLAYSRGANVGIADAINNTNIFIIIIFELLILRDRSNLQRKIFSAAIAFAGVILISLNY